MILLLEEEIMFYSQYLDFRIFHECKNFKICYFIIDMIASYSSYRNKNRPGIGTTYDRHFQLAITSIVKTVKLLQALL